VVVSSNMQMSGITAAQFNTPAQTAAFATAVESSLTIDATVTNVVASNIVRRRLTRRTLLQSGVDVSYDLQVAIEAGSSATAVFAEAVADLTQAVTGDDSPLATALAEDLGVPVVLDTDAFVAPTSFTQATIKVSTNAPTLYPTFRTVDSSLNIAIIAATAAVTAVALCVAGIGWFQYMKLKAATRGPADPYANDPNNIGLGDLPTAEAMVIGMDDDQGTGVGAASVRTQNQGNFESGPAPPVPQSMGGGVQQQQSIEMQIRANVAQRKLRAESSGRQRQQQSGGSAEVAVAATVTVTAGGGTDKPDDKPDGKDVPVAQGVVLL